MHCAISLGVGPRSGVKALSAEEHEKRFRAVDEALRRAYSDLPLRSTTFFVFAPNDPRIEDARTGLEAAFSECDYECWESLRFDDMTHSDALCLGHLGQYCPLGALYLPGESVDTTGYAASAASCSICGRSWDDVSAVPKTRSRHLPKGLGVFHLFYNRLVFCRSEFVAAYEKLGLTGLRFILASEKEPPEESARLYRAVAEVHRWAERDGVCSACESKTNVMDSPFFNLEERYIFDFQIVRLSYGDAFVLSRRAMEFLSRWKKGDSSVEHLVPIMPGYLREWISPEPRFFERPPVRGRILVPAERRPTRAVPTPEEWFASRGRALLEDYEKRFPPLADVPLGGALSVSSGRRAVPGVLSEEVLCRVGKKYSHTFAPAAAQDVARLTERQWPVKLIEFYAQHEPHRRGRGRNGKLRLYPIGEIFSMMEISPCADALAPLGYAPLAENEYGDLYLYNLNALGPAGWPKIVLASHEHFTGDESEEDIKELIEDFEDVADDLPAFLTLAAEGALEKQSDD